MMLMTMYVVGKTTLDTRSILLTELRAFSESQIVLVTHLLQVQSSVLLSVI